MKSCPNCPGAQVEYDNTTGSSYCTVCGTVLEESTITSEITFVEGGDGSARMVGNFLSAERSGLRTLAMRNRRMNAGQSREETIDNARRRFQEVSIVMKGMGEYHTERAVQCYKLALMHGFTNGRKQAHVIAACLYIVCRQEKTMHMLIDFSDALHTNVFALGNAFLKLVRLLNINLPLIDPSLYLARFAAQLNFGDKTAQVTTDALRLVQRMKRDWIHYGRRPSGICGACLFIAARMHGFTRSQTEIIRIVKICEETLKKRLEEFSKTPSATLSVEEFRNTDLSSEANPPSFRRDRKVLLAEGVSMIANTEKHLADPKKASNDIEEESELDDSQLEKEMNDTLQSEEMRHINLAASSVARVWHDVPVDEDISAWEDLKESDIEDNLLTEEETKMKQEIWEDLNKDWERLQEAKKAREEQQTADGIVVGGDKRKKKSGNQVKRQRHAGQNSGMPQKRTQNTARDILAKKIAPSISKKINYAALDQLFD